MNLPYFVPVPADPGTIASTGITLSGLAKILALIGTLFAVLNAPSGISQLIGSDLSVSSALQSLQTTMIGAGLLSGAGRMLGSTAKDAGALVTYGTGRMLGGSSIGKQIQAMTSGGGSGNPLVSERAALGGIQGGFESMNSSSSPGLGDFAAGFMTNGLPNIAKPISEINVQSGSFSSIMSNHDYSSFEKIGRTGLRGLGWGASRAYAAASNRVASFGHRNAAPSRSSFMPNMSLMNSSFTDPNSTGGNGT